MKTSVLILVLVTFAKLTAFGGTLTNLVAGDEQQVTMSVSTGQVAKVIYARWKTGGALTITNKGEQFTYSYWNINITRESSLVDASLVGPPIIVGPATITFKSQNGPGFCTIELNSAQESLTPSTAVVVPADAGGPVNVVLESSTDLITWTPALPGSYGTSTQKRFFRVRAERTQQ